MFIKCYTTQQLLKSADLLRESGDVVVDSQLYVLHLMQNLLERHNDSESVKDRVSQHCRVCFNSTTLKIS